VGSEREEVAALYQEGKASSSHPVGLELRNMVLPSIPQTLVIIPHGGLGTMRELTVAEVVELATKSPSHSVGLELFLVLGILKAILEWSPSHAVGLEQIHYLLPANNSAPQVFIPPSGLGTSGTGGKS